MPTRMHEELTQRWQTPEGRRLQQEVLRHLQRRRDLSQVSFLQRHQGRYDLRGIDLSRTPWHKFSAEAELSRGYRARVNFALGGKYIFKGAVLRDADLSYANLGQARFEHCHFENTIFHDANYVGVGDESCTFLEVDFGGADMRGATMGLGGARYEAVSFRKADMRTVHCYRGYFIDCDFSDARLEEVDFSASHLINCRFKGKLRKVWFRGYYATPDDERAFGKTETNPMANVDFSESVLWEVMFRNSCDLSTVIIPQDGEHFLFHHWPRLLSRAMEEVEEHWKGAFKDEALLWLRVHARGVEDQEMYIVNRRDVEHPYYTASISNAEEKRRYAVALVELLCKMDKQA